jgi:hypothetical protein
MQRLPTKNNYETAQVMTPEQWDKAKMDFLPTAKTIGEWEPVPESGVMAGVFSHHQLLLVEGKRVVVGRYEAATAGKASTGDTLVDTRISDSSMSRKQGILEVTPDGRVVLQGGGPNPVVLLSSTDAHLPKELKRRKKNTSAQPVGNGDDASEAAAELQLGDVFELDGFKRKNWRRYPEGPRYGYKLVKLTLLPPEIRLIGVKGPRYLLSSYGHVVDLRPGRPTMVPQDVGEDGFRLVKIDGTIFKVHELVAKYFAKTSLPLAGLGHLNGMHDDNRASNLGPV